MKILSPTLHGAFDYGLALAFLLAPSVLGFPNAGAVASQIYGAAYLAASVLTRYPLGLVKWIPFRVHGVAETVMAASWLAAPWVLDFARHAAARSFFLLAGLGLLAVVLLTDYRAARAAPYAGVERRRSFADRRQAVQPVRIDQRRAGRDRRGYA